MKRPYLPNTEVPSEQAPAPRRPGRLSICAFLVALVLVGMQFVPVRATNPPQGQEPLWDSEQTRALAQKACFDCHSNETRWPWYAEIAPVSWWVIHHVDEAREELNFMDYKPGDGAEAAEEVEEGDMPLPSYLWLHSEATLSAAEKAALAEGLKKTLGAKADDDDGGESDAHEEDEHDDD